MRNSLPRLFQLRVLRFRGDENGNVRVGVFPEGEEILIGRLGFGGVAFHVAQARAAFLPDAPVGIISGVRTQSLKRISPCLP